MTHSGGDTVLFESICYDMVEKGYLEQQGGFLDKLNKVITSFGTIVVLLSE
jgi:hypothetical protein